MPSGQAGHQPYRSAGLSPDGPALSYELGNGAPDIPTEEDQPLDEDIFRTPFPRPRVGALRNILAFFAVGLIIIALVWFFDSPAGLGGSQAITLTAAPSGPAPRVGEEAPDFRVRDLHGDYLQLSDFLGRPVWVNFWATWCPPCRAETPDIQEVYEENQNQGLVVIALSIGEDAGTVGGYVERTGTTFTIGLDRDTSVAATYRIVGIPTHFFIDRDGILREWRIGSMSKKTMDKKVDEILAPSVEE